MEQYRILICIIDRFAIGSPQPSERACDVEEQPSARGRLRAAGPHGPKPSCGPPTSAPLRLWANAEAFPASA